ncbi:MAG: thioredoxin [Proteobacteria bacterium]|nr:thioredoxin [Pseudomonadota bacterium]
MTATAHVFSPTIADFEADVLQASVHTPVLIDFWAAWCGPCKTLGPIVEKLAAEFNGAFRLAKIDVDKEQELAAAFQIRSIPTVILVKGGQPVDGFQGALPEGQIRQFLKQHGIEPAPAQAPPEPPPAVASAPLDPHAEVMRLRAAVAAEPAQDLLKLDLALALLKTGAAHEAEQILDALPANLATDERALRGRAHLALAAVIKDAPPTAVLEAAIAANPDDLRARHLLGAHWLLAGRAGAGLEQFIEMLRRNRGYEDGLPRRALIEAFRLVEDADLIGTYRRKMSSLLF